MEFNVLDQYVSDYFRKRREDFKYSTRYVAGRLGLAKSTYYYYEMNYRSICLYQFKRVYISLKQFISGYFSTKLHPNFVRILLHLQILLHFCYTFLLLDNTFLLEYGIIIMRTVVCHLNQSFP